MGITKKLCSSWQTYKYWEELNCSLMYKITTQLNENWGIKAWFYTGRVIIHIFIYFCQVSASYLLLYVILWILSIYLRDKWCQSLFCEIIFEKRFFIYSSNNIIVCRWTLNILLNKNTIYILFFKDKNYQAN